MIVVRCGAHLSALGISNSFTLALPDAACTVGPRLPYVVCLHDYAHTGEQTLWELCCQPLVDKRRFAILLPNGQNSCFLNMTSGPKWQTFLMEGLIPLAERLFPLTEKPALMGIGTGGWAAARLKGLFPDRFTASAAVGAFKNLPEQYARGELGAMPDLEAALGDPLEMETYPLSPDTLWLQGEGAALKALACLTGGNGSAGK